MVLEFGPTISVAPTYQDNHQEEVCLEPESR